LPNGGVIIDVGVDKNRNGQLDPGEVKKTDIVCNAAAQESGPSGPRARRA